jgi:hypothetical protein
MNTTQIITSSEFIFAAFADLLNDENENAINLNDKLSLGYVSRY